MSYRAQVWIVLLAICLLLGYVAGASASVLTTVAGNGAPGFSGDNGAATHAMLNNPIGVVVSPTGDLFFSDCSNNRVRKVNHKTGVVTTIAGNGADAFSGDGGPATEASLAGPTGLALANNGDLYIADTENHRVRKIDHLSLVITTVAGTGDQGFSGDGGSALLAQLKAPEGLALAPNGDLYIADSDNHAVRKVQNDVISTVAGIGGAGFSGDGGPAAQAQLKRPEAVALDAQLNLYISDCYNNRIRMVNHQNSTITTIAGTGGYGVSGNNASGTQTMIAYPMGLSVAPNGDLYFAEFGSDRLRVLEHNSHTIRTIAGTGKSGFSGDNGPPNQARLEDPTGVALSGDLLFVVDSGNHRIRAIIPPSSKPRTLKRLAAYKVKQDPHSSSLGLSDCPEEVLQTISAAKSDVEALVSWKHIQHLLAKSRTNNNNNV